LFDDLEASGFSAYKYNQFRTVNKGHGRIEIRQCWTISDLDVLRCLRGAKDWQQLRAVVKVQAERRIGSKRTVEERYYISSLEGNAKRLLDCTRTHWHIENRLHLQTARSCSALPRGLAALYWHGDVSRLVWYPEEGVGFRG
jgi:hypothetical protein